jgi:hypothetical protein
LAFLRFFWDAFGPQKHCQGKTKKPKGFDYHQKHDQDLATTKNTASGKRSVRRIQKHHQDLTTRKTLRFEVLYGSLGLILAPSWADLFSFSQTPYVLRLSYTNRRMAISFQDSHHSRAMSASRSEKYVAARLQLGWN